MHRPNLRGRQSRRYANYELAEEFIQFVDTDVLPHVELPSYKRAEKQTLLRHATHNLILTGLPGLVVADGRTSNDERRQPLNFREHIATVAQRGPDGRADPRAIENGMAYFRAKEDTIESINRSNLEHGWAAVCTHMDGTTTTFQPNVCLRQIHVGTFFEAARLYSFGVLSGQNLSKAVRSTMRIDGERAAEFDFSGMHPRMLYSRVGHRVEGDPYKPEAVLPGVAPTVEPDGPDLPVRDFLKRCLNACLNARGGRGAVHSSISNKLRALPNTRRLLEEEVGGVAGLVDRLLEAHAPIARYFFTGIGMELMTQDGIVMLTIMRAHRDARKPALPIHDSVVCRASDAEFTRVTMAGVYRHLLAHHPVIKRVF